MTRPKATSKNIDKKSPRKRRNPLNTNNQVKTRREYIDYDYVSQLSNKERKFLEKFTDEYYGGGGFSRQEDDTYDYSKNVHKTDELRKECYRRNTNQNKDLYNLKRISGKLDIMEDSEQWDKLLLEDDGLENGNPEVLFQQLHDNAKDRNE